MLEQLTIPSLKDGNVGYLIYHRGLTAAYVLSSSVGSVASESNHSLRSGVAELEVAREILHISAWSNRVICLRFLDLSAFVSGQRDGQRVYCVCTGATSYTSVVRPRHMFVFSVI